MPIYLRTRGYSCAGIAICDRCGFKYRTIELKEDGDKPGLMVCRDCWDPLGPDKYPPKPAENITLPFTRPDLSDG